MIYKSRTESIELQILRSLNNRMELSPKDKQHYFNLKKGYEGELMFDTITDKLKCECLILNDLLFKVNSTAFQLDSVIITPEIIYTFEVKNFEGDFFYEGERLYKKPKSETNNPLNQLGRSETLFRQLLLILGYQIPIKASVVFINPEFTLLQAPLNKPLILPTQIKRYLLQLDSIPLKLNSRHLKLADKLVSQHISNSPFMSLPAYDHDKLQKGITCENCNSFSVTIIRTKCVCHTCKYEEIVASAVMRIVKEVRILFPGQKITTNLIHNWCKVIDSKKRIRLILEKNLKIVGTRRWTYYIE